MDFQIPITEAALADFEGIIAYSWANFPATAERFGNAILNHIELPHGFRRAAEEAKRLPLH